MLLQAFAEAAHLVFKPEQKFEAHIAHGVVEEKKVHLLLPMTYMNLSGRSVKKAVDYYKLDPEATLVISDDVDLEFKQMRLRSKGGSGGHQGLNSIQGNIGNNYPRLRIGIGDRLHGSLEDYVLGKFTSEELSCLDEIYSKGIEIIHLWLKERIDIAMNLANIKSVKTNDLSRQRMQTNHLPPKGEEKINE